MGVQCGTSRGCPLDANLITLWLSLSPAVKSSPAVGHVREAVLYRGLFTAGWFGVREKHYFWLKIYDPLRASEQVASRCPNCPQDVKRGD